MRAQPAVNLVKVGTSTDDGHRSFIFVVPACDYRKAVGCADFRLAGVGRGQIGAFDIEGESFVNRHGRPRRVDDGISSWQMQCHF